jgi:hypothetical protein
MRFRTFGIVGIICALAACATTGKYQAKLNGFKGQPAEAILAQWGTPKADVILDNGDRMLGYIRTRSIIVAGVPGMTSGLASPTSLTNMNQLSGAMQTDSIQLRCMTKFFLHDGAVQSWTIAGNDCKSR